MNKLLIIEEGKSNLPVVVITFNSEVSIVDYWIRNLEDNPGKYRVEMVSSFLFSQIHADSIQTIIGTLLLAYEKKFNEIAPGHLMAAFMGVLHGFAVGEEREDNSKGKDVS